jgi:hypothetical protein
MRDTVVGETEKGRGDGDKGGMGKKYVSKERRR